LPKYSYKDKLERDLLFPPKRVNELKQVSAVLDEISVEALGEKIKEKKPLNMSS